MQGLGILKDAYGQRTMRITGEDPCAPTGSVLLVRGPIGNYPNPYAYLQLLTSAPEREEHLHWLLRHMAWAARADMIVFINPKHLGPREEFVGPHLEQFTGFLGGLCAKTYVAA
ncbi:MAG TPA: hypothetical protein VFY28_02575 [Candidatus Paceibacterota bacterium]|nr:hypothetical protein [Candidatus Paceibacterota bacterium]